MKTKLVIAGVAAAAAALCLAVMLAATGGHLSMPLDDAFIFFQYAKRWAAGSPFTYQAGGGPSAGATGLLTVWVDTLGYLAGFRGPAMALFAVLSGGAAFAWAAVSAHAIGRRIAPRAPWIAPALILTSGPLLWGFLSGMDLPLFAALALATAAAWPADDAPFPRRFFVFGALLGLARPDALFLVLPAFLFGFRRGRRGWWALPWAGAALPFALQWILTGRPQSASMEVKSVLGGPGFNFPDWFAGAASYLQIAIKGALGGGVVRDASGIAANDGSGMGFYLVPFALALVLLGLVPGAWSEARRRRPGPHALLLAWIALSLLAVAFTVPRTWHWHRYLMPVYAFVLPGVAAGADRVGRWVEQAWAELAPPDGTRAVGVALVALALPGTAFFVVAYGRNCADIYFQQTELARRLAAGDPVHPTRLGLNDAGALAYYGDYPVTDFEGLVDESFREPGRLGSAGVWEELERLPPGRRPDVLAVYPGWFDPAFLQPHRLVGSQRLYRPSIAGGNPMNVYRADWSLAGSGDLPHDPGVLRAVAGMRLAATVDVADLASERAAGYRLHILDGAYQNLLRLLPAGDGREVLDGGRIVSGGESFTVTGLTPGREVTLAGRSHAPFRLRVDTGGGFRGMWVEPGEEAGKWQESTFVLPAAAMTSAALEIDLASDDPHHSAYGSFHYWVYQR